MYRHPNPVKNDVKMILSPKCLWPVAKLLVAQWRSQTID